MKLHFEPNLDYQLQAIEAVCDLFRGQEVCRTEFTVTMKAPAAIGVWGAVERKTGLGACHCKMIGIPASKAGQFMKRKKSYAKPRRASVAD